MTTREPTKDETAFLAMLASGSSFEEAACGLGVEQHLRVPFQCVLNGWVDRGRLTKTGQTIAHEFLKPPKWEISVLPSGEDPK